MPRRAEDRAAHGLIRERGFLQPVKDDVIGRVERLPDFLQDHAAFHFDLGLGHLRIAQDVAENIHGQRHIAGQHPGIVGRALARGIGVQIPADILDLLGDLQRRAPGRALERHVLEEMGDTVLGGALVPGACIDPDPHGGRGKPRHVLCGDTETIG